MVLKADGSKYACASCLKGHRVSACNHTDRELIFVPKKGRPVTQCQHCRQERKKRSAHVKCDCGETEKPHHPREKCIHLREAEERAKVGLGDEANHVEKDPAHLVAVAAEQGCCCHHGGKCTCSLIKKETDHDASVPHGPAVKPRLEKTNSDSSITVFSNGHHKPVHRKNHAAHECGMPYKMPMPRSVTDHGATAPAHRSAENLLHGSSSSSTNQPAPLMPLTIPNLTPDRRISASEFADFPNLQMPPTTLGDSQISGLNNLARTQTNPSIVSATSDPMSIAAFDPMSGVAEDSFDPWSSYPSGDSGNMSDNGLFTGWSLPLNDFSAVQPALTAGSSGTQSEADEIPPADDVYSFGMPGVQGEVGSGNDELSGNSLARSRRSLPAGFFGNVDFVIPDTNNEWQPTGLENTSSTLDAKHKLQTSTPFNPFDETWPVPPQNVPQRQLGNLSNTGRPSQTVAPRSAPGDEIIRQLFPDFDVDGGVFGSGVTGSPVDMPVTDDTMISIPTSGMDLGSMDLGPMDNAGFTQQSWSDGSVSIPNDSYSPTAYDYGQGFSTPDLTAAYVHR